MENQVNEENQEKNQGSKIKKNLIYLCLFLVLVFTPIWVIYASFEPNNISPIAAAKEHVKNHKENVYAPGVLFTATLVENIDVLLTKNGGYTSNDILAKVGLFDNIPNWEKGVLFMIRDAANTLRSDFSRSQTQSLENVALKNNAPKLEFSHDSWILPSSESQYVKGQNGIKKYLNNIVDPKKSSAQFYTRADNLNVYLSKVNQRMGSLSQRLVTNVGQERVNTDLSGDNTAKKTTAAPQRTMERTDWLLIDDAFWEARGSLYALTSFFKAIKIDFKDVLIKKNAMASLDQIIVEMDETQRFMWSPMVLNGGGFGFVSNHSLTMASYISRANAAIIDLKNLLENG
jgi:hypothetical protein